MLYSLIKFRLIVIKLYIVDFIYPLIQLLKEICINLENNKEIKNPHKNNLEV